MIQGDTVNLTKTPFGSSVRDRLAHANDMVCFFAFQTSAFDLEIKKMADLPSPMTAADAFADNPFAKRINLSMGALAEQSSSALGTAFQMGLVWSVEHALTYARQLGGELKRYGVYTSTLEPDATEEEKLEASLGAHDSTGEMPQVARTLGFFRHARNVVAHAYDTPTTNFLRAQSQYGAKLDKFWASTPSNLFDFQFAKFDPTAFGFEDCLAAINAIRSSVRRCDKVFAKVIPLERITDDILKLVLSANPTMRRNGLGLAKKAEGFLEREYGLVTDGCEFSEYLTRKGGEL